MRSRGKHVRRLSVPVSKERCHRAAALNLLSNAVQPGHCYCATATASTQPLDKGDCSGPSLRLARVVGNDALVLCQDLYQRGEKYPGGAELQKCCMTQARRTPVRAWLGDVSASMLQQSLRDLDQSFRNWWRREGNARAPRFKRRNNRQSIPICGKVFRTTDQGVYFPKIGELRLR